MILLSPSQLRKKNRQLTVSLLAISLALASTIFVPIANAQQGPNIYSSISPANSENNNLELAPDSPFRDPNIIYLEADELINHGETQILTAQGEVEGRYQDRTLRADKVVYNLETGRVFAVGNVVLIDPSGAIQYSDKLELSSELEAGTASNFSARLPGGGITGAALAVRGADETIELVNAYYTACEPCKDEKTGKTKKPTWRLRARRVRQDQDRRAVVYNDAIVEIFGLPVFYLPYLAHPDQTVGQASGFLAPYGGSSSNKGLEISTPYYWAIDDHSDVTVTPHIYSKINPLLELEYRKLFHAGALNINASGTYSSIFDNDGNAFDSPSQFTNSFGNLLGDDFQGHIFADGYLELSDKWDVGLGVQATSNDFHLDNYSLGETPAQNGLYDAYNRRLISQAYLIGQGDDFRVSLAGYSFRDLRSRIIDLGNDQYEFIDDNDEILPQVLPSLSAEYSFNDPLSKGRTKLYGDANIVRRDEGTDYSRASIGFDYSNNAILPGGIEVTPFLSARHDYFNLAYNDANGDQIEDTDFSRDLAQIGIDMRYPFIRKGENVDIIIEPRALITETFGNAKLDQFNSTNPLITESLFQDSIDIDLDHNLLFESNKATGYDYWQDGLRADIGINIIADWEKARAKAFIGKSFSDQVVAPNDFPISSGLMGDNSDLIGLLEFEIDDKLRSQTRIRYDDDDGVMRRLDSNLSYTTDKFSVAGHYYRIDDDIRALLANPNAPTEQLSTYGTLNLNDSWSISAGATHDFGSETTLRQRYGLAYKDDCTQIELVYNVTDFDDATRNSSSLSVRVSLLSLIESNN